MLINSPNLKTLFTGFKALFDQGLSAAPTDHELFTLGTPSTTAEEEYPWLGDVPGMKKWVGDRVLNNLKEYGYKIRNDDFEDTVQVPRNVILDDRYGVYNVRFRLMGQAVAHHPCQLSYAQLLAGFSTVCYDGQFFFDTDHPVLDADGTPQPVANTDGGTGQPWFLMCSSAPVKPIILQNRQEPVMTALDNPDDPNVFYRKQYIYGADSRRGVGYGLWQSVWGSKQPLNAANYAKARAALINMTGDYGRPLGNMPDVLLVGGTNESAARKLANNDLGANGESNEWKGTARVVVSPWLGA